MAIDTVRDILGAVPGATPTNTFRTPEHNRRVGGVPGSFHTRGSPDNPRAVDLVPAEGESMGQLEARLRSSGVNTTELINEGDHIHVAVDGQAREQGGGGRQPGQPGYVVTNSEDLAPGEAQRLLASGEYQIDPNDPTKIFRVVGREDVNLPAPLDNAYAERQAARESLALDQEEADLMMAVQFQTPGDLAMDAGRTLVGGSMRSTGGLQALIAGTPLDRSMGERAWDNVDQAFNLSAAGYLDRMVDPQNDGVDPIADFFLAPQILENGRIDPETGKPLRGNLDAVLDWMFGDDRGFLRSVTEETRRSAPAIAAERARRQRFQSRAEQDPVRNVGDALASLLGTLGGSAVSPENWVAPGRTLVQKVVAGGAVAGGGDALLQGADVANGVQDEYNAGQTVGAVAIGSALNGLTEIVGSIVRARRNMAAQRGLQVDPVMSAADAAAEGQAVQTAVREALGNPEAPRFRVAKDPEVVVPFQTKVDAADGPVAPRDITASTDNVFDINLARINTPEDVQAVIVGMADRMAKDVDLARRGTQSWDATREAANGVDWVSAMGARQPGGAVNAETALAYRLALNSSATKLLELARKVETEPTLANQFAFRRATATHSAIQNELMGARAEAGRALNAFKIPADAPATYLRQVDSLIADVGGANSAQELARRIRQAAEQGDNALNQMVRGGAMARTREIVKLVYTNSLLSGLGTPIINAVGTPIAMLYHVAARAVSPRLAGAFGGTSSTQAGEASALVAGYIQATRDVFKLNPLEAAQRIGADAGLELRSKGLFRGMAPGIDDAGDAMGLSLRSGREEAGSASARPLGAAAWRVAEDTPLGRVLDIMQMVVEAPSNITGVTDDFWKVVSARGELHAQALRISAREGLQSEAARARIADLIENPTDDMMVAAEKAMHELTFTRSDGQAEKKLQELRRMADDALPGPLKALPLATYIVPFLRTPMNLMSLAARSSPLAPFSARFINSLKAGGAEAETAKAQAAVGTALWSVWMGMAMDGQITGSGPSNTEQRAVMMREDEYGNPMWQPYSVKLGGRWYSYERMDPVGSNLSLIGDFAELLNNDDWNSANLQEGTEIAANAVLALGQAYFDKSMLQGAIEFTSAISSNDVSKGERFLMGRASALVPASGALRMLRRGQDPYLRETHNAVSAMRNTIPLLSEGLPLQRDLWGRPRTYQTGLGTVYDAVMPVQTRAEGGSAIDLEILNNGVGVAMPNRSITYMRETVSLKNRPDIYSEFLRLSGEPAFEHLNAVAEGRHPDSEFYYSLDDGPTGGKADYIKEVMSAYRDEARAAVTERFASDLQAMASDRVRRREEARAGE